MANHEEVHEHETDIGAYPRQSYPTWRRISWGAIFAGLLVTLGIFLTLQMLGAGIGLAAVDLTGRTTSSGTAFGIGAAIWWLIMGLISLFAGGWVAGRLATQPSKLDRALHGLTTWAFFYVVMFWVVTTTVGSVAGGSLALIGKGASAAGQAAASPQGQQTMQSQGLTPDAIRQQIASALGTNQPAQVASDLAGPVADYLRSNKTPQDRQQVAQAITQKTGKSEAEANQIIDKLDRAGQQARETGQQVANVTGATFIALAISMILGAVVAALGGFVAPGPRVVALVREERGAGRPTTPAETDVYAGSRR